MSKKIEINDSVFSDADISLLAGLQSLSKMGVKKETLEQRDLSVPRVLSLNVKNIFAKNNVSDKIVESISGNLSVYTVCNMSITVPDIENMSESINVSLYSYINYLRYLSLKIQNLVYEVKNQKLNASDFDIIMFLFNDLEHFLVTPIYNIIIPDCDISDNRYNKDIEELLKHFCNSIVSLAASCNEIAAESYYVALSLMQISDNHKEYEHIGSVIDNFIRLLKIETAIDARNNRSTFNNLSILLTTLQNDLRLNKMINKRLQTNLFIRKAKNLQLLIEPNIQSSGRLRSLIEPIDMVAGGFREYMNENHFFKKEEYDNIILALEHQEEAIINLAYLINNLETSEILQLIISKTLVSHEEATSIWNTLVEKFNIVNKDNMFKKVEGVE